MMNVIVPMIVKKKRGRPSIKKQVKNIDNIPDKTLEINTNIDNKPVVLDNNDNIQPNDVVIPNNHHIPATKIAFPNLKQDLSNLPPMLPQFQYINELPNLDFGKIKCESSDNVVCFICGKPLLVDGMINTIIYATPTGEYEIHRMCSPLNSNNTFFRST